MSFLTGGGASAADCVSELLAGFGETWRFELDGQRWNAVRGMVWMLSKLATQSEGTAAVSSSSETSPRTVRLKSDTTSSNTEIMQRRITYVLMHSSRRSLAITQEVIDFTDRHRGCDSDGVM